MQVLRTRPRAVFGRRKGHAPALVMFGSVIVSCACGGEVSVCCGGGYCDKCDRYYTSAECEQELGSELPFVD